MKKSLVCLLMAMLMLFSMAAFAEEFPDLYHAYDYELDLNKDDTKSIKEKAEQTEASKNATIENLDRLKRNLRDAMRAWELHRGDEPFKILVTYDSFRHVRDALEHFYDNEEDHLGSFEDRLGEFQIVVDEFQSIFINFMISFIFFKRIYYSYFFIYIFFFYIYFYFN